MKKSNPILFIFLTILIDCIGLGIIIPIMPDLIVELTGESVSKATQMGGWLMASYALMQFFFSPVLGGISDRFGRRPVLLISLLGLGIDYVFLAFASTISWLFLGRIIAGVCGASFTTGMAYIADVSKPEDRAKNFGMVGVAFGLGFIIGPILGSLFGSFGIRVPFIAAASLSLLNFLFGYFILPESLAVEKRRKFEWKRANPFGAILQIRKKPALLGLIFAMFFIYLAGQTMPSIWTFFTKYSFGWDEQMNGYSLAFVGVCIAFVQGGLVQKGIQLFGNVGAVYVGMIFNIIGFILFSMAGQPWMMFAFTAIYAIGGIGPPALQGIASNRVPDNEQGELQGVMTSMQSITSILNPLLMTQLFYAFTNKNSAYEFPGIPFAVSAVFIVVAFFFFWRSTLRDENGVKKERK